MRTDVFVKRCALYVEVLPITEALAVLSVQFVEPSPARQEDLEDRLIGATAVAEGRPVLTHDRLIVKLGMVPLAG